MQQIQQKERYFMGMGYGANWTLAVDEEALSKSQDYQNFIAVLKKNKADKDSFAQFYAFDSGFENADGEELDLKAQDEIMDVYRKFQSEFKEKFGITIDVGYHSKDDHGDRYDEVDGAYFEVEFDDVYEMTPKAKAFKEEFPFEAKYFVHYG